MVYTQPLMNDNAMIYCERNTPLVAPRDRDATELHGAQTYTKEVW